METADYITVEVVYALPGQQRLLTVTVPRGSIVASALRESRVFDQFPGIDRERVKLGIFGRRVSPEHVLQSGDRIEIYRNLVADPKAARQKQARRIAKNA